MGDQNFMAGLMGGLGQSLQKQQEFQQRQEYQKALIDINKMHGKLFEAQMNASNLETELLKNAIQKSGLIPGGTPIQPSPQPLAQQMAAGQMGGYPATGPPAREFSDRFLEGYLKKKFGMEPNEVLVKPYGDHQAVYSKTTGTLLGIYPGQGKTVMQEIIGPTGAKSIQPILAPPAPLPPGVPIFGGGQPAIPGQAQAPSGGMQTAPPAITYHETSSPTGGKALTALPTVAPPGTTFPTGSEGIKPADMGRVNMVFQADNRVKEVNKMLFPKGGGINRPLILKATAFGGIGEGAQLYSKMYQAVDSALRLETGAQANAQEIEVKMREYWPSIKDTEATIKQKMKDLTEYVSGVVNIADPTGQLREMRQRQPASSVVIKVPEKMNKGTAGAKTIDEYFNKFFNTGNK